MWAVFIVVYNVIVTLWPQLCKGLTALSSFSASVNTCTLLKSFLKKQVTSLECNCQQNLLRSVLG